MVQMIKDQRGVNPLMIVIIVALLIVVSISGVKAYGYFNEKQKKSEIDSFKGQLEVSSKSYLTANSSYPTKPALQFEESVMPTYVSKFFKQVAYFSGITTKSLYEGKDKEYSADYDSGYLVSSSSQEKSLIDSVILSKVLNMDTDKLVTNKYLSEAPKDDENYFLSTVTGYVYYINDEMSIKELSDEAKRLAEDSGNSTGFNKVGNLKLEKDGKVMDKIITSATNRDFILYGGEGTMRLAKVVVSISSDNTTSYDITDLSSLLQNDVPADAITEIRLLSSTSAVVHYFDSTQNKMLYQTISF